MRFREYEVDDADPAAIVNLTGVYEKATSITTAQLRAAGDELAQAWLVWCDGNEPRPQDDCHWVVRVIGDNDTVFGEVDNGYDDHGCYPLEHLLRVVDIESKEEKRCGLEGAQESVIDTLGLHVKANSPTLKLLYDALVAARRVAQ